MPRFFVNRDSIEGGEAAITGADAYHIARSLRMAVGDTLTLCDKEGMDYLCRLEQIRDDRCALSVLSAEPSRVEMPVEVTLFMAYPKGDKLGTVIQKSVELGATVIRPFESSRCVKRPTGDRIDKQLSRLRRIAEEAAKQCGRGRLPTVSEPLSFSGLLSEIGRYKLALFCYEGEGTESLRRVLEGRELAEGDRVAVIVGCEGGFSPEEAEAVIRSGGVAVGLGPRILRCETAPDYALSALSYHFEL